MIEGGKCIDNITEVDETFEDIYEGSYDTSSDRKKRKYINKLSPAILMTDWRFMEFSERKNKKPQKSWDYRKRLRPIISKIWEVAGKEMVERDGGVFLDKLGYFFNWMSPTKRVLYQKTYSKDENGNISWSVTPDFLLFTGGYWYFPTFLPDMINRNAFYNWAIDSTMDIHLRKSLVRNLKRGKKYVFHYAMLKTSYSSKKVL